MARGKRLEALDAFLKKRPSLDRYLTSIDAHLTNYRTAEISEQIGRYKKIVVRIGIGADGEITLPREEALRAPSESDTAAIKAEFAAQPSPTYKPWHYTGLNINVAKLLGLAEKAGGRLLCFLERHAR